jgi:hypothetical protein
LPQQFEPFFEDSVTGKTGGNALFTVTDFSYVPCCGSGIFIQDTATATKDKEEIKFVFLPFLWPQISQNLKFYF